MAKQKKSVAGITIEWDDAKHSRLNATDGPWDKHDIRQSKNKDDEFTPKRIVADLKLDLGDAPQKTVYLDGVKHTVVDPNDVHLKVTYHGEHPTVGWWNGAKWVKFNGVHYDDKASEADVILPPEWPIDPPIGTSP